MDRDTAWALICMWDIWNIRGMYWTSESLHYLDEKGNVDVNIFIRIGIDLLEEQWHQVKGLSIQRIVT